MDLNAASEKAILLGDTEIMEIQERDQANNLVATYIASGSNRIDVPENRNSYAKSVLNAFMPAGYPHSVTDDYLEYQIYDSLQAFSSSIAHMLSSRAVLQGIGVGDSTSTPTAALFLSVLQESMGRIATILFAHRLGTSLEPECKMYRFAADILNDSSMILDCFSPYLPKPSRVVIFACASVLRSLCGVAANSSKASLSAHFATQGNLGELNAKDSSQETVISLVGMLAGTGVVSMISSTWATWTSLISLLIIHLWTNYLAVRAVKMDTLNRQRANIVFTNLLDQTRQKAPPKRYQILTPKETSAREKVFEKDGVLRWNGRALGYCKIGISFSQMLSRLSSSPIVSASHNTPLLASLLDIFREEKYILLPDYYAPSQRTATSLIVLKDTADTKAQLKAWMHALYAADEAMRSRVPKDLIFGSVLEGKISLADFNQVLNKVGGLEKLFEGSGWDIDTGALETKSGFRISVP